MRKRAGFWAWEFFLRNIYGTASLLWATPLLKLNTSPSCGDESSMARVANQLLPRDKQKNLRAKTRRSIPKSLFVTKVFSWVQ